MNQLSVLFVVVLHLHRNQSSSTYLFMNAARYGWFLALLNWIKESMLLLRVRLRHVHSRAWDSLTAKAIRTLVNSSLPQQNKSSATYSDLHGIGCAIITDESNPIRSWKKIQLTDQFIEQSQLTVAIPRFLSVHRSVQYVESSAEVKVRLLFVHIGISKEVRSIPRELLPIKSICNELTLD